MGLILSIQSIGLGTMINQHSPKPIFVNHGEKEEEFVIKYEKIITQKF
jgi:hypothetical protein